MDTSHYINSILKQYRIFGNDADDIAQEIHLQILKNKSEIKNPKAWIFTVAKRTIGKFYTKNKSIYINYDIKQEEDMKKEELLELLPPLQRRIVDLYIYSELQVEEIQQITGIPAIYVQEELDKAFHILKERIINEKEEENK